MEYNDTIHRLQIIRDLLRCGKFFDADFNLESIQKMIADEKLTLDNNDEVKSKSCGNCCYSDALKSGHFICKYSHYTNKKCLENNYLKWEARG